MLRGPGTNYFLFKYNSSVEEKHFILITDMKANYVRKVGCHGNNAGQLLYPADVTYLNDDNILVVDQ